MWPRLRPAPPGRQQLPVPAAAASIKHEHSTMSAGGGRGASSCTSLGSSRWCPQEEERMLRLRLLRVHPAAMEPGDEVRRLLQLLHRCLLKRQRRRRTASRGCSCGDRPRRSVLQRVEQWGLTDEVKCKKCSRDRMKSSLISRGHSYIQLLIVKLLFLSIHHLCIHVNDTIHNEIPFLTCRPLE